MCHALYKNVKVSLFKPPYKTGIYPYFADEEIIYIYTYGPHIFSTTSTSADLWFTRVQTGSFLFIQKKVHHYKVQLSIKAYSLYSHSKNNCLYSVFLV